MNQPTSEPRSTGDSPPDSPPARPFPEDSQEQFQALRDQLTEWTYAARVVVDPDPTLTDLLQTAEALLERSPHEHRRLESSEGGLEALENQIGFLRRLLDQLRRRVRSVRNELRSKAERLAGRAAAIDAAMPVADIGARLVGREAEAWEAASRSQRAEARRRLRIIHRFQRCTSTDDLRAEIDAYKADHPGEAVSVSSFYRWRGLLQEDSVVGLLPDWSG